VFGVKGREREKKVYRASGKGRLGVAPGEIGGGSGLREDLSLLRTFFLCEGFPSQWKGSRFFTCLLERRNLLSPLGGEADNFSFIEGKKEKGRTTSSCSMLISCA